MGWLLCEHVVFSGTFLSARAAVGRPTTSKIARLPAEPLQTDSPQLLRSFQCLVISRMLRGGCPCCPSYPYPRNQYNSQLGPSWQRLTRGGIDEVNAGCHRCGTSVGYLVKTMIRIRIRSFFSLFLFIKKHPSW
eukprot:TRINITY_DN10863_c1_g1_i1.p1 TRINITY_DN10863_c1_g1~~TRINITY_DN10863_c1_g1_i1.p1  ORF type:complete len:134 (-),score=8.08 TRINITY_DN10863_c1_g1_i1:369-770(-)